MELKSGYKQTEVGIIPKDWEVCSIAECSQRITDGEHITPKRTENGYYLLSARNILNGRIDVTDVDFVGREEYLRIRQRCNPEFGDVLISCSGSIGRVTIVPESFECVMVRSAALIKPNYSITLGIYVQHYLQSSNGQKQIFASMNQGAQPNLFLNHIQGLRLAHPSISEQALIATALSDGDALINSIEKLIAKKRNIKQGAMQKLLQPKDGWDVKTLKEVAKYRRGSFPQPYGLDKWYDDSQGLPFVQVYDVDDNFRLKSETKRKISKEAQEMSVFIEKGSIIITLQGSIGRIAITQYDAYVDRTLLFFESFLVPFDKYFFMLSIFQLFEKEKEKAPGGIIKTITKEALSSFTITYPKIEEQTRIATILLDMNAEIAALETKLEKYRNIKLGMMQNLLTGGIRLV